LGAFSSICVGLFGAYAFTAAYALILWARDRRARLPLLVAAHAVSAAALALSLLWISRASTVGAMQMAVTVRVWTIVATGLSVTAMLALASRQPMAPWLGGLGAYMAALLAWRHYSAPFAADVVGVQRVVSLGEWVWAPVRAPGLAYLGMLGLLALVAAFALLSATRLWKSDRFAGVLLGITALAGLLLAPRLSLIQAGLMTSQLIVLVLQLAIVLLGVVLLAREHESRARTALAAERLYRGMFDQSYQFLGVLDLEGRVLDANRTSLASVGLTVAEVRGQRFEDTAWWQGSADRFRLREALADAAAGVARRFEASYISGAGPRLIDFSVRPLRNASGTVIRLIPEARDITEERAAQEAHRKADLQLQQSQKLEAVGQLAGGIAHDFNNLLTVIHGFAGLLAATPEARARGMELEQIQAASERAMSLTRQLLTFSRHAVTDDQVLDINALVQRAEPLLGRMLGADVALTVSLGSDAPRTKADPAQLERVLINLVANARDAMTDGGRLRIITGRLDPATAPERLRSLPGAAMLTVSDTGHGMSPDVVARLFEPFFTTKGPGRGTGLGLAVVDRVVKQAGGLVDVVSAPGAGTTFTIALPAVTGTEDASEGTLASPGQARTSPTADAPGGETVLVVDDEPPVRHLAAAVLLQRGYRVLEAGDPSQALEVARAHGAPIDLLLADVVMPGGSARTIAEGLASQSPPPRVLYMSGYPADEVVRRGVATGTSSFLQKPFTPDRLAQLVRSLLDAPPTDAD
jgi:PAS domain S-box-containing protein